MALGDGSVTDSGVFAGDNAEGGGAEGESRRLRSALYDKHQLSEAKGLLVPSTEKSVADDDEDDSENGDKLRNIRYPKAVYFIVIHVFCERFAHYGVRALLAIYLHKILLYSVDSSTVIFHVFVALCYFLPVVGAVVADSLLGKYRTIFYLSVVYVIGFLTLTVASADVAVTGLPTRAFSMLGLTLIAAGMGGLNPCVSAFGGNQFTLPQQQKHLDRFFSVFIFSINFGSFLSTFLIPILREDVHCLGKDSCYPLAFGVPVIFMILALVVFIVGKKWYIICHPEGNILMQIIKVIWHATRTKWKSKEKKEHWLDYASDRYSQESISDIKSLMQVIIVFTPLPLLSALEDQQGSRWTFQASRMNGVIGDWVLKPEQMQLTNSLMILAMVPLFETVVYPLAGRCNLLTKPLQRLGCGGVLAALAFLISAALEVYLEPTYAVLAGPGEAQFRLYNDLDCPVAVTFGNDSHQVIAALGLWELHLPVEGDARKTLTIELRGIMCALNRPPYTTDVTIREERAVSYLITSYTKGYHINVRGPMVDDVEKSASSQPKIRLVSNSRSDLDKTFVFVAEDERITNTSITVASSLLASDYEKIRYSRYQVFCDNKLVASREGLQLELGGVYTLLLQETSSGRYRSRLHTITQPNSVHMLWLLPQYTVLTMGEVMYAVTGIQFAYTQASTSMKSVVQAGWLLVFGFGNVIVVLIAQCKIFKRQRDEFLLFSCLMLLAMIIFAEIAWNYEYVETRDLKKSKEKIEDCEKIKREEKFD